MIVCYYTTIKESQVVSNFYAPSRGVIVEQQGDRLECVDDAVSCAEAQKRVDSGQISKLVVPEDFIDKLIEKYRKYQHAQHVLKEATEEIGSAADQLRRIVIQQEFSQGFPH